MARGRRAHEALAQDTTPGKVLALAILANAPIAVGVILVPLLTAGDVAAAQRFRPVILWGTPALAVLSLFVFFRATPERRQHRAARIGVILAAVALLLWLLVALAPR